METQVSASEPQNQYTSVQGLTFNEHVLRPQTSNKKTEKNYDFCIETLEMQRIIGTLAETCVSMNQNQQNPFALS